MTHSVAPGVVTEPVEPLLGGLKVHGYRFDNGLVLKVVPDHRAPVVAYQTWFGVGSADEFAGKTGLAHLFEHLMFKGTDQYADGEYMAQLEAMGAEGLNAWTWLDMTVYLQAVPARSLDDVARLESIRMHGLRVDQASFSSELEVVMNERRLTVDNDPDGRLNELLFATAYAAHPYGVPTIGWMADLEKMQVDDAVGFYKSFYAPDNATIVVVGDVQPDHAAATVHRHYGALPATRPQRPVRKVEPDQGGTHRAELTLPITGDRVLVAFKLPAYTHADIPALLVLDAALTAGQTGRLPRSMRDTGFVADVGGSVLPMRDPSLYQLSLHARPGVPATVVEERFWQEIARVREQGISDGELRMGIAQWEAATLGQLEDDAGRASFLGWALVHTGRLRDGLGRVEAIRTVTAADVRRVAATYLVPERATVVTGRAESPAPLIEVNAPLVEPAGRAEVEGRAPAGASNLAAAEVVRETRGGAKVMYVSDPALPLVYFRLWFPTGSAADPKGSEGLANLTGRMLLRGTRKHPRRAYEEALEQLGATLGVSVDADGVLISGSTLASTWPRFASLVAEALAEPAFEPEEIAQLVREVDNELAAIPDDDGELASIALAERLWGRDHPYGRDTRGTRGTLPKFTQADLHGFHRRHLRAGGAIVGIAGGFDAQVGQDVDAILAAIAGEPAPVPAFPAPEWPAQRTFILVDKPERTQAQVMMGQLGVHASADDFPAFVLANDAFGVGFGGRLFKEIRMKNGWSYYAYSGPRITRGQGSFELGMAPGNPAVADAIATMLRMVEDVHRDGFRAEEIEQVRAGRLNGRPFLADTARKTLDLALRRDTVGYDRLAATERMATVSLGEANAAYARVLAPSRLVVSIVGTASEIRAAIEEKVGPVEVIDYRALTTER